MALRKRMFFRFEFKTTLRNPVAILRAEQKPFYRYVFSLLAD